MKLFKRICAIVFTICTVITFQGCKVAGKTVYVETSSGRNTVFKIGDMKCSKKEAFVYLLNEKNIYGSVDGVNLWTKDFDTKTMTRSIKDLTLEHLTRVYVLNLYAKEKNITLTDEEEETCKKAGKAYYKALNAEERSFTGAGKGDIIDMYERYALAEKVYNELMNSVDEEVSEDEARVMEAFVLFVTDKAKADEIQGMIDYGYTFERLASTYTELDSYQVTFARKQYPKEVDDVVFNLDTEQVSGAIEADGGYYFFQCLNKYNEELSEQNKAVIIDNRRKHVLDDIVDDLEKKHFSDINKELWDSVEFPKDASKLTNGSFFETLHADL